MDSEPTRVPEDDVPVPVLPEDLAPALSQLEPVADIWAADARESRYVAERALSVARFARRRRRERLREFGRPWDTSRPPVTALLTIHAPLPALSPAETGAGQPAVDVSGEIVTAAQCRGLLDQLRMLGVHAAPAGGGVQVAVSNPATGRLIAVSTRSELRRGAARRRQRTRRGAGAPQASAPSAHTANDDGPGVQPPCPTFAYRPTASQQRFVRVRDRHCRWPGCVRTRRGSRSPRPAGRR